MESATPSSTFSCIDSAPSADVLLGFALCTTDRVSMLLTWVLSASFSFVTTCSGHSASCITAWDVQSASLPALVGVFLGFHVHPPPILGFCAGRSNPRPIQRRAWLTVGISIASSCISGAHEQAIPSPIERHVILGGSMENIRISPHLVSRTDTTTPGQRGEPVLFESRTERAIGPARSSGSRAKTERATGRIRSVSRRGQAVLDAKRRQASDQGCWNLARSATSTYKPGRPHPIHSSGIEMTSVQVRTSHEPKRIKDSNRHGWDRKYFQDWKCMQSTNPGIFRTSVVKTV